MQSYTRVTDLQKIRTVKNNDRHNSEIRDSCPEIYIFLLLISYIISSFFSLSHSVSVHISIKFNYCFYFFLCLDFIIYVMRVF